MRGQRILDRYGLQYDPDAPLITQRRGHSTLRLDARSSMLLNAAYATQADVPGEYLDLPATAAGLKATMPAAAITTANVRGAYLCDTASPLVCSLGLGPNLVAIGAPLAQRQAVGLPTASFNSKLCVEGVAGANQFADAGHAFGDVNGGIMTFLMVFRLPPLGVAASFITKIGAGAGWYMYASSATLGIYLDAGSSVNAAIACVPDGGAWHWAIITIDDVAKVAKIHSDLGTATSAAYVGAPTNAASFAFGFPIGGSTFYGQIAAFYVLDAALTAADGAAFWRPYTTRAFNTPSIYTRTTPLRTAITASRVAAYGAGQVGVGFDAAAVDAAGGNALGTGVMMEEGAVFLPFRSATLQASANTAAAAMKANITGASGMFDGVRGIAGAAWAVPFTEGVYLNNSTAIAGATAVPWLIGGWYKRGSVGTTARIGAVFTGDPGGREDFIIVSDAVSPVDWTRFQVKVTPVRNAHTMLFIVWQGNAIGDSVDVSDLHPIQNYAPATIATWALTDTATPVTTVTPAWSLSNAGNIRFNPARGAYTIDFSGFPGVNATFLGFGAALAAGTMILDYAAANLRLRIYDSAGALVDTVLGGALGTGRYSVTVLWDAYAPLPLPGAPGQHMALCSGSVVLGASAAAWTPALAGPGTLHIGTLDDGSLPARCIIY